MVFYQFFLVYNIFIGMTQCLPMPETKEPQKDTTGLCVDSEGNKLCMVYNWISGFFEFAKESVDVIEDLELTGVSGIFRTTYIGFNQEETEITTVLITAQDYIDDAKESFDYYVGTGVQFAKDYIPPVKSFINDRLDDISSLGDYLNSQVDQLPDEYRKELRAKVDSLINILPRQARPHPSITYGIERELPPKEALKRWVGSIKLLIEGDSWVPPASERVEERLDDILNLVNGMESK